MTCRALCLTFDGCVLFLPTNFCNCVIQFLQLDILPPSSSLHFSILLLNSTAYFEFGCCVCAIGCGHSTCSAWLGWKVRVKVTVSQSRSSTGLHFFQSMISLCHIKHHHNIMRPHGAIVLLLAFASSFCGLRNSYLVYWAVIFPRCFLLWYFFVRVFFCITCQTLTTIAWNEVSSTVSRSKTLHLMITYC